MWFEIARTRDLQVDMALELQAARWDGDKLVPIDELLLNAVEGGARVSDVLRRRVFKITNTAIHCHVVKDMWMVVVRHERDYDKVCDYLIEIYPKTPTVVKEEILRLMSSVEKEAYENTFLHAALEYIAIRLPQVYMDISPEDVRTHGIKSWEFVGIYSLLWNQNSAEFSSDDIDVYKNECKELIEHNKMCEISDFMNGTMIDLKQFPVYHGAVLAIGDKIGLPSDISELLLYP